MQQSTRISFHPIDGIPVQGRKRCFPISLQELTHANDHIQGRPHFMSGRSDQVTTSANLLLRCGKISRELGNLLARGFRRRGLRRAGYALL